MGDSTGPTNEDPFVIDLEFTTGGASSLVTSNEEAAQRTADWINFYSVTDFSSPIVVAESSGAFVIITDAVASPVTDGNNNSGYLQCCLCYQIRF